MGSESSLTKTVCEDILLAALFRRQWVIESDPVIDPTKPLTMSSYRKHGPLFGHFDLRDCVGHLDLDVRYYGQHDGEEDQKLLPIHERRPAQLSQLSRPRRFKLTVWTLTFSDAYHRCREEIK